MNFFGSDGQSHDAALFVKVLLADLHHRLEFHNQLERLSCHPFPPPRFVPVNNLSSRKEDQSQNDNTCRDYESSRMNWTVYIKRMGDKAMALQLRFLITQWASFEGQQNVIFVIIKVMSSYRFGTCTFLLLSPFLKRALERQ